jgi:hypothetical protein
VVVPYCHYSANHFLNELKEPSEWKEFIAAEIDESDIEWFYKPVTDIWHYLKSHFGKDLTSEKMFSVEIIANLGL